MNLNLIFGSGDYVLMSVFMSLVIMSVLTWTIFIVRLYKMQHIKKQNHAIKEYIGKHSLANIHASNANFKTPMASIVLYAKQAVVFYGENPDTKLTVDMPFNHYLSQEIRHCITQNMRPFERGMSVLASVGSTAPFIGLFGTVWGIYHALIGIGTAGQVNIADISAPIGEALVATAAGLFVAIPAVLFYNYLLRANKSLLQDLQAFSYEIYIKLLSTKE